MLEVEEWFSHFNKGEMSIHGKPRSGCPLPSATDKKYLKNSRNCVQMAELSEV